jgi:hypothetical protein
VVRYNGWETYKIHLWKTGKYIPDFRYKNRQELPCISDQCEMLVCKSAENQKVGKHHKKKTSPKRRKHKFINFEDSLRRDCASEVKYDLGNIIEAQGGY